MIYIAYKYTNTEDKKSLRKNLETIAKTFEDRNHPTFVLFRDKKKWGESHDNKFHSLIFMVSKILVSSQLVVFVDHEHPSPGLTFELRFANMLKKPITLLVQKNVEAPEIRKIARHIIEFADHSDLETLQAKIPKDLKLAVSQQNPNVL